MSSTQEAINRARCTEALDIWGEKAITVESLGDYIITGCPYCHRSYCD